jgi:hypothetical protein
MCADTFEEIQADADYSTFFLDEGFQAKYPDLKMPPPSFCASGARILSFDAGKSIVLAFPVREDQTNPINTLQGGVLCNFSTTPSARCPLSLRNPAYPLMTVNFIRSTG